MMLKDWQNEILREMKNDTRSKGWFKEKMSIAFVMLRNGHGHSLDEIDAMQSLFDMTIELIDEN
jgi:hypothetical protein